MLIELLGFFVLCRVTSPPHPRQPRLKGMTLIRRIIVPDSLLSLSNAILPEPVKTTCSRIRAGTQSPHPRHWEALHKLTDS